MSRFSIPAICAILCLLPVTAAAEADVIGLYTTSDGYETIRTTDTSGPFEQISVYLVLLESSLGGASAWEARIDVAGNIVAEQWAYYGDGLNVASPPLFNVGIGLAPNALWAGPNQEVLLATCTAYVVATSDTVTFTIDPYPDSPSFPNDTGPGYFDPYDSNISQTLTIDTRPAFTVNHVPPVIASFTADPTSGMAPLEVSFTNESVGLIDDYLWNFGDGHQSYERDPVHTYSSDGGYIVTLWANYGGADVDTTSMVINVQTPSLHAAFSADPIVGTPPLTVDFTDQSTGAITGYYWAFGDADTSTEQNPSHTYTELGIYDVMHVVTGAATPDTAYGTIQVVEADDILGLYAAPCTNVHAIETLTPFELVTAYLIGKNLTHGGVAGWQCQIDIVTMYGGDLIGESWSYSGATTINAYDPTDPGTPGYFDVGIGLGPDALRGDDCGEVILAEFTAYVSQSTDSHYFEINPLPGGSFPDSPGYVHPDNASILQGFSVIDVPAFTINDIDPTVTASFDVSPATPYAGHPVQFTSTSTGPIVDHYWSFGDGGTSGLVDPAHTYADEGQYTVELIVTGPADPDTATAVLDVLPAHAHPDHPAIASVLDVPNDQGRQVRLAWSASQLDAPGSPQPITGYAVYRLHDPDLAAPPAPADAPLREGKAYPPGEWDYLLTVPARAEDVYATIVPTLADSTIVDGLYESHFFVSAMTDDPATYFDSTTASGYSVDNLAPAAPGELTVAYAVGATRLEWETVEDEDFDYFNVYRGSTPDFVPGEGNRVHQTAGTGWLDPHAEPWGLYYLVSAVDFSGNESPFTSADVYAGLDGGLPTRLEMGPATPNPFNPVTSLMLELPAAAHVRVSVFDLRGQQLRTLHDGELPRGRHEVVWRGRDDRGREVSAGTYLVLMDAEGERRIRRATLVK